MMPELFLAVTLIGACFTFNAYLPQRVLGLLTVPSFFAGWLTSELASHHFAWQLVATAFFVAAGALESWPGWLGLGITAASWAGLYGLAVISERASGTVEAALSEGLGQNYREQIDPALATRIEQPLRSGRRLVPFLLFDPEVKRIGGISYAPEHGDRGELDVYVPKSGASRAPVLLQVHGGAWMIGEKRQQALPLMLQAARAGWVCVAANYRLSPAATFPDHLIDLKRALAWIRDHIDEYGGDPNLVCVTGGSAGGHLSSLIALTANEPEYQPGFEDVDTSVVAAVPFYGVYDFTNSAGRQKHGGMQGMVEKNVIKLPLATHAKEWEKASPLFRVHPGAPPFFIVHGSHDSLAPASEGRLFAERLRAVSKSPVCYAEIPGAQHAFEVFHSKRTTHVVRSVERFLGWAVARERARLSA